MTRNDAIRPTTESDWLTPAAAAFETHVGKRTIHRAVRRGQLKAARVGGRREIRIHRGWLNAWLEG